MNRETRRIVATIVFLGIGWGAQQAGFDVDRLGASSDSDSRSSSRNARPESTSSWSDGVARIERAAAGRESGLMVTVDARVAKKLSDDVDGSRHQRFLIELGSGRTLLVAHNIDLADRIALREGDVVRLRGQYEWNDKGGLLHWTHHDPDGSHPGGWIESGGVRVE